MKNSPLYRRLLSVVLALAMTVALLTPVSLAKAEEAAPALEELELTPVDPGTLQSQKLQEIPEAPVVEKYSAADTVRVSIVLEKASTIAAGYSLDRIAYNEQAKAYRQELKSEQAEMAARIGNVLGCRLDVKVNLTLVANIISANVLYGQIDAIKAVPGVKNVFIENIYELDEDETAEPQTATSALMTGTNIAWAAGYTGAGSKIAIIDTGIDADHLSFDEGAFAYSLAQNAEAAGLSMEEYLASLDLLDEAKIAEVADQLNRPIDAAQAYINAKLPFGYNYASNNYDTSHLNDAASNHGSHVAGISAANRYIPTEDGYELALDSVIVQGMAPDAQILTMKVFNSTGTADSDYMDAIEDAIILGADAANLSLGSGVAGKTFSDGYEDVMDMLVENGMVVAISAGNAYSWYDTPYPDASSSEMYGYLYADDVKQDTVGSPGSFPNALTVASVDNAGTTGMPIKFGDLAVFYNESQYTNEPIATLAPQNPVEYVLVDSAGVTPLTSADSDTGASAIGTENDDFAQLGSEVLAGKVALCWRGSSSFYVKAEAAVAQGAIGVIIMNNKADMIGMNLQDYTQTAPVVLIPLADGEAILAQSEEAETEDGLTYYTGTMTITDKLEASDVDISDGVVQASDFSSWGIPESLIMKPEIMAPGGNIYSVNGASQADNVTAHDQYIAYSGTSMAAPQVAGMAAVMAQYIRENDLVEKTGLSARQLTNSLLMGTALPVYDSYGDYWSVLKVGAGLANVGSAVMATSYILMDEDATLFPDSAADGKVKAELGDDPERTGEYSYGFTVYPLGGSKEFTLRTDIFTQWLAGDAGYGMLQDYATILLGSETTYEINGVIYEDTIALNADVNRDEVTDEADAQAILDHITGAAAEDAPFDADAADVDGDRAITTVDARLILEAAATPVVEITEPTHVTVNIKLDPADVEFLNNYFTGGFFVEGYTYLEPVATEEGALTDVIQSVPILGFCGSWTDAAMFDRTSVIDQAYGTGRLPYLANTNINFMTLKKDDGSAQTYRINPYAIEDEYPAGREAINSSDTVSSVSYLNIRHMGATFFAVQDEDGTVIYAGEVPLRNEGYAPYYYVNGEVWRDYNVRNGAVNKSLSGLGLEDGQVITVGFYGIPEYYAIKEAVEAGEKPETDALTVEQFTALLEDGAFGEGAAAVRYTMTVDNEAPVANAVYHDMVNGDLRAVVSDNNYVAYMALTNISGTTKYFETVPEQTEAGEQISIPLTLEGQVLPSKVTLLICDYAGNEAAYQFDLGGSDVDYGGTMIAFTNGTNFPGSGNRALQIDPATVNHNLRPAQDFGAELFAPLDYAVTAAEYVDGYVFMAADDGRLYAGEFTSLNEAGVAGNFSSVAEKILDMAFNYTDSTLYAIDNLGLLYTVDLVTGALTEVALIESGTLTFNVLAIDDDGTFYTANKGNNSTAASSAALYTFTLDDVVDGTVTPVKVGNLRAHNQSNGGALAWDHDKDILYFISCHTNGNSASNALYTVNLETGKADKANSSGAYLYNYFAGLFIVPSKNSVIRPTDTATGIEVSPAALTLLKGQTYTGVEAVVYPWNLTDKTVTWESADPAIAAYNNGKVTGVSVGETRLIATTAAEPHLTAEIPVIVKEAPVAELRGIIWDEQGRGNAASFRTNATEAWESASADLGQLRWGVLADDKLYGSTDEELFMVDADTYDVISLGGIVLDWVPSDAAALPADMAEALELGRVVGFCQNGYGNLLELLNPEEGSLARLVMSDLDPVFDTDPPCVIAYIGRGEFYQSADDAGYVFMTESGNVYLLAITMDGSIACGALGATGIDLTGAGDVSNSVWASLVYDDETGFLYLAHYDGEDDYAWLYAIDAADPAANTRLGNFRTDVWPVVGLYEYVPTTDLKMTVNPLNVTVFAGATAEISVKIKNGTTNAYTAEVVDEEVAQFEDGVVTGVAPGKTKIKITTVDTNEAGDHLTATVNVTVREAFDPGTGEPTDPGTYPEPDPRITGVKQGFYFETDPEAEEWIFWDRDGDGYTWEWATGSSFVTYEGTGIIHSASYVNNVGALHPDNFAISPALDLSGLTDANLSLYACGQDSSYAAEKFAIYAGTTNDPSQMTKISETFTATSAMKQYLASLKDFAGESSVFVAIRHFNVTDMFYLNVDAVELLTADGRGAAHEPAPAPEFALTKSEDAAAIQIGTEVFRTDVPAAAQEADGGLNRAGGEAVIKARPAKGGRGGDGSAEDGIVTVTLTEDADVTNGLIAVEYDPELLTYDHADSPLLRYVSWNEADGAVYFAYASAVPVPAGEVLTNIYFTYTEPVPETEIHVTTLERNDDTAVDEEPAVIKIGSSVIINGVTLALDGRLAMNMYITAPESAATATMTFHGQNEDEVTFELIRDKDHFFNSKTGQFRLPYKNIAAKEMTCPVELKVFDADGSQMALVRSNGEAVEGNVFSFRVVDWANATITGANSTEAAVNLAKSLLNYGGAAQEYFGFKPDDNANPEGYLAEETAAVEADPALDGDIPADAKALFGYAGLTLNLEGDTELRIYFTKDVTAVDDAGIKLPLQTQGKKKYVSIPNIASVDLDALYPLTISLDGQERVFTLAALTYANKILAAGTNEKLVTVMKALYIYNEMAEIYFNKVD